MEDHKRIEQRRYDDEAAPFLGRDPDRGLGAAGVPAEYRAPYAEFEKHVVAVAKPDSVVLDIGAGTGAFSASARGENRLLIATDIAQNALRVAKRRATSAGVLLYPVCADAERLPFRDGSVNLVTAAGALYCFDLSRVSTEVRRVLKPDGTWIIVDSLNDNPLYRFNRWIGRIRHRRTALAVRNVPTNAAIQGLAGHFRSMSVAYHGILTFLLPIVRPILGSERAGTFITWADGWLRWLSRWAFKVVVVAQHPR